MSDTAIKVENLSKRYRIGLDELAVLTLEQRRRATRPNMRILMDRFVELFAALCDNP